MMEIENLDTNKAYTLEECVHILMQSIATANKTRFDTTSESLNCDSQIPTNILNISFDEDKLFSQSPIADGSKNGSINQLMEKSSVELNMEKDEHHDLFQLQERWHIIVHSSKECRRHLKMQRVCFLTHPG